MNHLSKMSSTQRYLMALKQFTMEDHGSHRLTTRLHTSPWTLVQTKPFVLSKQKAMHTSITGLKNTTFLGRQVQSLLSNFTKYVNNNYPFSIDFGTIIVPLFNKCIENVTSVISNLQTCRFQLIQCKIANR